MAKYLKIYRIFSYFRIGVTPAFRGAANQLNGAVANVASASNKARNIQNRETTGAHSIANESLLEKRVEEKHGKQKLILLLQPPCFLPLFFAMGAAIQKDNLKCQVSFVLCNWIWEIYLVTCELVDKKYVE